MQHPDDWLPHLLWLAELDANYARWRAASLRKEFPVSLARLPAQLDEALTAAGIPIPPSWTGQSKAAPALVDGAPLVSDRRTFAERVRDEYPDCFPPRMRSAAHDDRPERA
ncbi:hypothetical protein [Pseudacidovorax intermedius]|uniref:Uncharacterized protein n=1 Tax=Pseudacidovorax intermedius TaxID=433924 RepID=A0A147GP13_9BURK|nr:hypothetical protein [Pseudacidovorax intermedius]KTT15850.1 hypothetical protein NS331_19515 [Pseudacidovorax intermedius]